MANHTITISNAIGVVLIGPGPSSKWGDMVWGVDFWGAQRDIITAFDTGFAESVSVACVISNNLTKVLAIGSLLPNFEMTSETLKDGSGYNYSFISNTTEGEERDLSTWSEQSDSTQSWTEPASVSSTWSEV